MQSFRGLQLNEFLLFHGLPAEIAQRVLLQGLDPRYAGEHFGKLFGRGIYTASNSSKSDIYTTPDADTGLRCMLVVRTCLGEAHMASQASKKMLRPPERADGRGPLSSVVALTLREGGVVEHPEFIVYKETQVGPAHRSAACLFRSRPRTHSPPAHRCCPSIWSTTATTPLVRALTAPSGSRSTSS